MDQILDSILQYILTVNNIYLYLFLFMAAFVENIVPPIPGDTITVFGAFMVGTGRLDYFIVYLATTLGSTLGFMTLYGLGRIVDKKFFHNNRFSFFSIEAIDRALDSFSKWGYYIVLANRFLPGVRSVISITAGLSKLKIIPVALLATISAMIWNLIWIQAGFMLGDNWERVKEGASKLIGNYNKAVLLILAILLIFFFLKKILAKRKAQIK